MRRGSLLLLCALVASLELPLVLDNASLRLVFGAGEDADSVAANFAVRHATWMSAQARAVVASRVRGVQRACIAARDEAEQARRYVRTLRAPLLSLQLPSTCGAREAAAARAESEQGDEKGDAAAANALNALDVARVLRGPTFFRRHGALGGGEDDASRMQRRLCELQWSAAAAPQPLRFADDGEDDEGGHPPRDAQQRSVGLGSRLLRHVLALQHAERQGRRLLASPAQQGRRRWGRWLLSNSTTCPARSNDCFFAPLGRPLADDEDDGDNDGAVWRSRDSVQALLRCANEPLSACNTQPLRKWRADVDRGPMPGDERADAHCWSAAQLLFFVAQPRPSLSSRVAAERRRLGLDCGAAQEAGPGARCAGGTRPLLVAMLARGMARSGAAGEEAVVEGAPAGLRATRAAAASGLDDKRAARESVVSLELAEYLAAARRLVRERVARGAAGDRDFEVLLMTDDAAVVETAQEFNRKAAAARQQQQRSGGACNASEATEPRLLRFLFTKYPRLGSRSDDWVGGERGDEGAAARRLRWRDIGEAVRAGRLDGGREAENALLNLLIAVDAEFFVGPLSSTWSRATLLLSQAKYGVPMRFAATDRGCRESWHWGFGSCSWAAFRADSAAEDECTAAPAAPPTQTEVPAAAAAAAAAAATGARVRRLIDEEERALRAQLGAAVEAAECPDSGASTEQLQRALGMAVMAEEYTSAALLQLALRVAEGEGEGEGDETRLALALLPVLAAQGGAAAEHGSDRLLRARLHARALSAQLSATLRLAARHSFTAFNASFERPADQPADQPAPSRPLSSDWRGMWRQLSLSLVHGRYLEAEVWRLQLERCTAADASRMARAVRALRQAHDDVSLCWTSPGEGPEAAPAVAELRTVVLHLLMQTQSILYPALARRPRPKVAAAGLVVAELGVGYGDLGAAAARGGVAAAHWYGIDPLTAYHSKGWHWGRRVNKTDSSGGGLTQELLDVLAERLGAEHRGAEPQAARGAPGTEVAAALPVPPSSFTLLRQTALTAAARFSNDTVDAVVADHWFGTASAAAVRADLEAWWPRVRPSGLMGGGGYNIGAVRLALDSFFSERGLPLRHAWLRCATGAACVPGGARAWYVLKPLAPLAPLSPRGAGGDEVCRTEQTLHPAAARRAQEGAQDRIQGGDQATSLVSEWSCSEGGGTFSALASERRVEFEVVVGGQTDGAAAARFSARAAELNTPSSISVVAAAFCERYGLGGLGNGAPCAEAVHEKVEALMLHASLGGT